MSAENTISDFINQTQVEMFADVQTIEQKSLKVIAADCKVSYSVVQAWASGRNGLTLYAVKVLLRARYMAPYLSRLFEPEQYALVGVLADDHDDTAAKCIDFAAEHAKARHPESECGVDIGPREDKRLRSKGAQLRAAA